MKITWNRYISGLMLAIIGLASFTSCSEDFPTNVESDKFTDLTSIRIINAGPNGDEVLVGEINENTKTISFPRIDTLSDFSKIKFEAVVSNGAKLEKDVFSIPYQSGDTQKDIIIKVVNAPRFKEYLATVRFKVPVYGADFTQPTIIDYSNNPVGYPLYPTYVSLLTRGGAFNGEYVFVPSRQGGTNPHILKVSELRNGVINKINLNTTDVTGGTLPIQTGAFAGDNLYVFNVSSQAAGFKIYFYENFKENYDKAPQVILVPVNNLTTDVSNYRFGENTSVNLDDNGNGYIFMPNNPTREILRLKIENYTQVVERTILPLPSTAITFGLSYNQIGSTSQFLVTSYNAPIFLMTESGSITKTVSDKVFELSAAAANIVNFNNERYLIYMTAGINSSAVTNFKVYNITRGESISDAIDVFAAKSDLERVPSYEFSLNGAGNAAPITHTSWKVEKDASGKDVKLLLYTTASDAGFTIFEFPINVAKD